MPCKYSNKSDTNYLHILHGPTLKIESKPKIHQEWGWVPTVKNCSNWWMNHLRICLWHKKSERYNKCFALENSVERYDGLENLKISRRRVTCERFDFLYKNILFNLYL